MGEIRVPTVQFGVIAEQYKIKEGQTKEEYFQEMVDDFRLLQRLWKEASEVKETDQCKTVITKVADGQPTAFRQTRTENGHVYKSARNEGTGKFYWMIDQV